MTDEIRAAGEHLMEVLKAEKSVRYSRFYNAEPGSDVALAEAVRKRLKARADTGEDEDCGDCLDDEAHLCVEWAAYQFQDRGFVRVTRLEGTELIDGEPDRIDLTPLGERLLAGEGSFGYHHLDNRFHGTPASEWLVWFLHGGGEGQHLTLDDVMDLGESDGEVEMKDGCGNAYPKGTVIYAWAFEVALWHHARSGHVLPRFDEPGQEAVWKEMVGRKHLFQRPDMDAPHPLWEVPFGLAPGVDPEKVRHVGWFGGE